MNNSIDYAKEFKLDEKTVLSILTKLEKFSERNFDEILPQEGIEFVIKEGLKLRGKDVKQALLDIENYEFIPDRKENVPCKILGYHKLPDVF